jgi:hypothetical protein
VNFSVLRIAGKALRSGATTASRSNLKISGFSLVLCAVSSASENFRPIDVGASRVASVGTVFTSPQHQLVPMTFSSC